MSKPAKKQKIEAESLVVQFSSATGEKLEPSVDLPLSTTTKQLETLLNTLLKNEEQVRKAKVSGGQSAVRTAKLAHAGGRLTSLWLLICGRYHDFVISLYPTLFE